MSKPLTPDILAYDLKSVSSPRVAPGGDRVVFAISEPCRDSKRPASQLWIQNLSDDSRRQLTFSGRNVQPRWSHHSDRLAFLSDRNEGTTIFVLPLDGGEAEEIVKHRSPIADLAWSPNGSRIAYTALYDPENPDDEEPDKDAAPKVHVSRRRDYKEDGRGFLNNQRWQLWAVDVASKERRRVLTEAVDFIDPAWSPDGKQLLAKILLHAGIASQLGLIDLKTGKVTRIGDPNGEVQTWTWSPDGTQILISGEPGKTFQPDFYLYTVATGETRRVTTDLAVVPESSGASRPFWREPNRVLFHAFEHARSGIYGLTVDTGNVEKLISWDAANSAFHVDGDGRVAVQTESSFDRAGELLVIDLKAGTSRRATNLNGAQLAETPPARWESFTFTRAGFEIESFLLYPRGYDAAKTYPLVIDIHGGPANRYGPRMDNTQQGLATAGYFVLLVNPRGSTTYGRAFAGANLHDWGGGDYEDLMAAVDRCVDRPDVDENRLGVLGYSYGGFMSSWTIGHTNRFKAAAIGAPVFDLISAYGTSDIAYYFLPHFLGGTPEKIHDEYAFRSPLTYLPNATTPSLILHGEADERCPIGQGEQLFTALTDLGVETEFARYPGGSHLFPWAGPTAHRVDYANRIVAWFDRFLK